MPRQTKKYVQACQLAGVPSHANIPNETVYGMLALKGYEWKGGAWTQPTRPPVVRRVGSVRVEAHPDDSAVFTTVIADLFDLNGIEILSVKGPYPNRKNRHERYYINFRYEQQKERTQ